MSASRAGATADAAPAGVSATRAARRWIPGEAGIWAFIFTDLVVFGFYFATFIHERGKHPEMFAAGTEALSPSHGALNTFFMLTASLFVALGIQHVRAGRTASARRLLVGAGVCGLAFIVNKPIEWLGELDAGHAPNDDDFFQLYYMLTGLHLVHVLIAMVVLAYMWRAVGHVKLAPTQRQARYLENGASYWHLVDLIWLVLFALFYLVR